MAMTGYVLARDSWGQGYATEALMAIAELSKALNIEQLHALCHPDNTASVRVLEKCNFALEQRWERFLQFPNLMSNEHQDCLRYVLRMT
jgi:RimJ/RimL family protein N-acetyltransferase